METVAEPIRPQPKQEKFLSCPADLCFYGGAAGSGKTYALLMDLARWVDRPNYRAVIFRRVSPEITNPGGLWDESYNLYPALGGRAQSNRLQWRFPLGAVIGCRHCQHEKTAWTDYKGLQVDVLAVDQVEDFTDKQFFYLLTRNRGSAGIRSYCRATCNPQPGWLADFLAWWIDHDTGYPREDRAGVLRYFVRVNTQVFWGDDSRGVLAIAPSGTKADDVRSCTFIPARAEDNPINIANNPGYIANLKSARHADMERLYRGNWKIRDDEGAEWPAEYFEGIYADRWPRRFELSCVNIDASEGQVEGDFCAITFQGLFKGDIYVDADLGHYPTGELMFHVASMAAAYQPDRVIFEGNQWQKMLVGEFERYSRDHGLWPWETEYLNNYAVNKKLRIRRLGGPLKGKRFKFKRNSPGVELLLDQCRIFPLGDYDDGPDCLEMGHRSLNALAQQLLDAMPGRASGFDESELSGSFDAADEWQ